MTSRRLVLRSLAYHWRTGVVVCFGIALATAVLTGSLVIGDSVTGSLRDTALARLGSVDYALVAPHFFRAQLAQDLSVPGARALPLLSAPGAARSATAEAVVPQVSVLGVPAEFWTRFTSVTPPALTGREAAVNAALAADLGLQVGDALLVTVGKPGQAPPETLFGRRKREETTRVLRLTVAAVLPSGVGDFRLDPSPAVPRNIFVTDEWLARALDKPAQANVLLVAGGDAAELAADLRRKCTLADYGLQLPVSADRAYLSVQSPAVVLPAVVIEAAQSAAESLGYPVGLTSTYLATAIRNLSLPVPTRLVYSVLAGMDPPERLPLQPGGRRPDREGICLNAWAAQDLGARVGDRLEVAYLVPRPDGTYTTATRVLTLRGIVEMTGLGADRGLVPEYEGITDAETMGEWKPPFPVALDLVTPRDDQYWTLYRAAPKAFVSMDTVRAMWQAGSSGGEADWVTSVRIRPPGGATPGATAAFSRALLAALAPEQRGLAFRPVRAQALQAARGTTDFSQLMLGMSMFLVLSAAGLAGMLLRLSGQRRAAETGLLLACGLTGRQVQQMALAEGAVITGLGAVLGIPLGVLYAAAVLAGLRQWWSGAVAETALWLHVSPAPLISGALAGAVVGLLAVVWGGRALRRRRLQELLAGWQALGVLPSLSAQRRVTIALLLAAIGLLGLPGLALAGLLPGSAAAFSAGALLLVAGLLGGWLLLSRVLAARRDTNSLLRLALRNAAANRGRSLLALGLLAAATFVIVATAANGRSFSRVDYTRRDSGTGGFALQAIATLPLYYDLGTPAGRAQLGFSPAEEATLTGVKVFSFLTSPGEDISCLNLSRPQAVRLLGVSPQFAAERRFRVAGLSRGDNPWSGLAGSLPDGTIPALGDTASVTWSLHSGLGKTWPVTGEGGRAATLRFTGLLADSLFQSELLVAEAELRQLYPSVAGPRYFLLEVPPGREAIVADTLRAALGDLGVQVRTTREVLDSYLRVQNTYLSMFVALGGLGVLLGTIGLVTVLLRSALERRGEFALMLATGFREGDLARLLVLENAMLLVAGVLLGTLAGLLAVAPQLASPLAQPAWEQPLALLVAILALGLAACWAAAHGAVRGPLLAALREE